MGETHPHTATATVNNETKKESFNDRDDNDDHGPDKTRRMDEVRKNEVFPLDLTSADPATCKLWDFQRSDKAGTGDRDHEKRKTCLVDGGLRVQGIVGIAER